MIRCATWMFFGPSSRAIACATARKPNFADAKAAKPAPPRRLAVAPVKKMLPRPCGSIRRADSRPARKPAQHAISHTFRNTRSVVSRIGKLTLAPTLKMVHFQWRVLVRLLKEGVDLVFLAGIQRASHNRAAGILDLFNQRRHLVAIAPPGEHGEAFRREFLGNLGADIVPGADHRGGCVALLQGDSPDAALILTEQRIRRVSKDACV